MTDPEPLPPPGTPSAQVAASQPPPQHLRMTAEAAVLTGSSAILLLTPASHHLLAHARTLAAQEHHQFAVVFAHAACELHTEGELIRLLEVFSDKLLADLVLPDEDDLKSLANPRVRRVYSRLTDDYPGGSRDSQRPAADWWAEWLASRKDRHAVAHKGAQMTRAQADAAIAVADRYITHVTEKVEAARERLLRLRDGA